MKRKLLNPIVPRAAHEMVRWGQLYGGSRSLALAEAADSLDAPLIVLTPSAREADRLEAELHYFVQGTDLEVLHFPDWETLPYDVFSPHQDIVSERLATLYRLPALTRGILVVALPTLMQRLAPREYLDAGVLLLEVGGKLDPDAMRVRLEAAGYACVSQVMEHGEFAVRGSLLDVFPMGSTAPYRIDLFDDEIESIRSFDPETQLSTEKLPAVRLLPAREFPLAEAAIRGFRQRYRTRFEGDPQRSLIYRDVSRGIAPAGIEYYLPLFFDSTATLFDYLPAAAVIAETGDIQGAMREVWAEIEERYLQRAHDIERPLLSPDELFLEASRIEAGLKNHARIQADAFELPPEAGAAAQNFASASPPALKLDSRAEEPAATLLAFLAAFDGRILFAADSAGRREQLLDTLRQRNLRPAVLNNWQEFVQGTDSLNIGVAPLDQGLHLPAAGITVITEPQLFGERVRQRSRRAPARDPDTIIRDLTDLSGGAPVVHEQHGVGRYLGLQTLTLGGLTTEFLTLEYAGGDKLYVPVSALHLISRYTGAAPEQAPLHRLGSDQWQKARRRAAEKARDAAAELLDIYARRAARQGHKFAFDEHDYTAFGDAFPFEETPDQQRAIDSVLDDLTNPHPMDRVVCGDVGFGKTEVALRAAFVAVQGGKQVAVLVPTTLLAQQHYQNFSDRFADWPIRVEVLSRFRSVKQQNETLQALEKGKVDIIIGTHALLSDRIRFKDLGLIIIDEEHRFGVRHKEKLKALRAEVHILTLTATPIPRTLNMSLAGIRDLSIIATPPVERLSIKTFVAEWNDALLREAFLREIKRGGQVYFVHNRVETIDKMAERIRALVPEADIRIAHGQMREAELEQVMLDFYHRRFNVLLSTTIIESGIDVPTANTIIINRADKFGLAQLHQMRGRVGRSHHRAYAYLITPMRAAMTADAVKRLEAIESLEDLGAGFTLATHDLEIRGAGELLGEEQSGQIHEVGFTLYTELLERAVKALQSGQIPDFEQPLDHGPEVELRIPALIPADYMPDVHMRLVLYKRIASAPGRETLRELQVEMIDRFGLLPAQTKNLFRLAELRLQAAPLGIQKIEAGPNGGRLIFNRRPNVDPLNIVQLIQREPGTYKLDGQEKLRFSMDLEEPERRFATVAELLEQLAVRSAQAASA